MLATSAPPQKGPAAHTAATGPHLRRGHPVCISHTYLHPGRLRRRGGGHRARVSRRRRRATPSLAPFAVTAPRCVRDARGGAGDRIFSATTGRIGLALGAAAPVTTGGVGRRCQRVGKFNLQNTSTCSVHTVLSWPSNTGTRVYSTLLESTLLQSTCTCIHTFMHLGWYNTCTRAL